MTWGVVYAVFAYLAVDEVQQCGMAAWSLSRQCCVCIYIYIYIRTSKKLPPCLRPLMQAVQIAATECFLCRCPQHRCCQHDVSEDAGRLCDETAVLVRTINERPCTVWRSVWASRLDDERWTKSERMLRLLVLIFWWCSSCCWHSFEHFLHVDRYNYTKWTVRIQSLADIFSVFGFKPASSERKGSLHFSLERATGAILR